MATTVTKRVSATAAGGQTRRVAMGAHGASYDAWARSWGTSWADHWRTTLELSELGHTARVSGTASGGQTKRVTI